MSISLQKPFLFFCIFTSYSLLLVLTSLQDFFNTNSSPDLLLYRNRYIYLHLVCKIHLPYCSYYISRSIPVIFPFFFPSLIRTSPFVLYKMCEHTLNHEDKINTIQTPLIICTVSFPD